MSVEELTVTYTLDDFQLLDEDTLGIQLTLDDGKEVRGTVAIA